ncbi:MAG: RagB/SusD family nutrient uptake outer membrane protein [Candidatus Pedobacter colombiensis]|uniref:RagB/SusD family nutrient uptake outer membrane protein n=1 Tax=Candidatus Pedobacter colombiensis TaxID=3121371 RepID=A0AAJ6B990_9SPHI|nr:RagB/SusD family nutrient uptake outer membrane protein [Pedobacter sp.]WEK19923.1 MAG: RagB/SusD family nutrient uptake outer membrane protein [Pedobacter sp.]
MNKIIKLTAILFLMISASSCKKYLDIEPVGKVIPTTVEDFRALLNSGYTQFPSHKSNLAFRTDELLLNTAKTETANYYDQYKWNDLNPDANSLEMPYGAFYTSIFYANSVIEDIEAKAGVSAETAQIKGEAYLLRAYAEFELLNLYAKPFDKNTAATDRGVPISLKIDLETNYKPSTVEVVYNQIFADLAAGQALLNVTTFPAGQNYRFTKRAALALTARIYEYRGEWSSALKASQDALAINNTLQDLNAAGATFAPNHYQSVENIMSMERAFNPGASNSSFMSPHLLGIYDPINDKRYALYFQKYNVMPWDDDYEENKDKIVSNKGSDIAYKITFRNAELYLIKAEAALQTDDLSTALQTLLALKVKRLTPAYYAIEKTRISGLGKADLYQEIIRERERELALEGHRWYDLRRFGQPEMKHEFKGAIYTLQKNDPRYTIRFPQSAIKANPNLQ